VATLGDLGAEHLGAVQAETDGVVLAVAIVARRQQQGFAAFVAEQLQPPRVRALSSTLPSLIAWRRSMISHRRWR
jgi:hypothetical protein